MANLIRISSLVPEDNLNGVIIPVDKKSYKDNAKQIGISGLTNFVLSGFTGTTMIYKHSGPTTYSVGGIPVGFNMPNTGVNIQELFDRIFYSPTTTTTSTTVITTTTTTAEPTTTTTTSAGTTTTTTTDAGTTTTTTDAGTTTTTTTTDPYTYYTADKYTCDGVGVCGVPSGSYIIKSTNSTVGKWAYDSPYAVQCTGETSPTTASVINCTYNTCENVCV